MNIFGIIGISLVFGLLAFMIGMLIYVSVDPYNDRLWFTVICGIAVGVMAFCIFAGISLTTEDERIFVEKFNAQKDTIEQSIASESITGLERVEIVKHAAELNSELAGRKARYNRWYFVCYDDSIYDNVELIDLRGETNDN